MAPKLKFPSMSAKDFKRLLRRELGYREVPGTQAGSHVWLESDDHPRIRWGFHDRELSGREVKAVLLRQAALTLDEAKEVLGL